MKIKNLALILLTLSGITHVQAHRMLKQDFICPIGGETFSQVMDMSGTSYGQMLNLKPFGPTAAPWRLAVCPGNQFVMYKDKFTDEEIKVLSAYVESPAYQKIIKETTYYRAAQLKRLTQEPTANIAYTLLQATWQSSSSSYLQEALDEYKKYIVELESGKDRAAFTSDEAWVNAQLIALQLERSTEQFDAAQERLKQLADVGIFKDDTKVFKRILDLQKKLVAEKDAFITYQIPDAERPDERRPGF